MANETTWTLKMKLTIAAGLTVAAVLGASSAAIHEWNELTWLEKWAIWRNVRPYIQDEPPPVETEQRQRIMRGDEPLKMSHSDGWFEPAPQRPDFEDETDE